MICEMGKIFSEVKGEIVRGVVIFCYYVGEGLRKVGDVLFLIDFEVFMYIICVFFGVVGVIIFWNFLVVIFIWKIVFVFIYGNIVILKLV